MKSKFNHHWEKINDEIKSSVSIIKEFTLRNGGKADIALFFEDECVAVGKQYDSLTLPTKENIRTYFHGNHDFIGCGTSSKLWFYFDELNIIINDHKYIYPYDELMQNEDDFLNRLNLKS